MQRSIINACNEDPHMQTLSFCNMLSVLGVLSADLS